MRDEQAGVDPEGRHDLGRVEHPDPARRAGPEVVHVPAVADPGDGEVDHLGQGRQDRGHGAGHHRVLRVEQPEQLERPDDVDVRRAVVAHLGPRQ
jgi:hypothetical protein